MLRAWRNKLPIVAASGLRKLIANSLPYDGTMDPRT
jgi:hypothetical protein